MIMLRYVSVICATTNTRGGHAARKYSNKILHLFFGTRFPPLLSFSWLSGVDISTIEDFKLQVPNEQLVSNR